MGRWWGANRGRGAELNESPSSGLTASPESGYLIGVSLFGVLQMLHLERKTCRIEVSESVVEGWLRLRDGEIVDAAVESLRGELAVFQLLELADPRIVLRPAAATGLETIMMPLSHLLMEAIRRQDETDPHPEPISALYEVQDVGGAPGLDAFAGLDDLGELLGELTTGTNAADPSPLIEHPEAGRFQAHLRSMLDIEGVLAAAVVEHAGDVIVALAATATSEARAARLAIPAYAGIVRLEVSADDGTEENRPVEEMLFSHDRQHNVVRLLGPDQRRFFSVAVSRPTGNLALTRRTLETVAEALAAEQSG